VRRGRLEPLERHRRQGLFRAAHAGAHQLVAAERDDEIAPMPEQPQFLPAGDLRGAEKLAGDHPVGGPWA